MPKLNQISKLGLIQNNIIGNTDLVLVLAMAEIITNICLLK